MSSVRVGARVGVRARARARLRPRARARASPNPNRSPKRLELGRADECEVPEVEAGRDALACYYG